MKEVLLKKELLIIITKKLLKTLANRAKKPEEKKCSHFLEKVLRV